MTNELKSQITWAVALVLFAGMAFGSALTACTVAANRDAAIGKTCVEQGGAWVLARESFQCVFGRTPPSERQP